MARRSSCHQATREHILLAAARLFLQNGYETTTLKMIASEIGTSYGAVQYSFPTKEDLLDALVGLALKKQFAATAAILDGLTQSKTLFYAAETVMQLYIAESNENLRELYCMAYVLPKPSAHIRKTVAAKLQELFGERLPDLKAQDFYIREIASGGIMRSYMCVPCDMWFTMDMKVRAFLETTMRVYQVPQEEIEEAIAFVQKLDYPKIARQTIDGLLQHLTERSGPSMHWTSFDPPITEAVPLFLGRGEPIEAIVFSPGH